MSRSQYTFSNGFHNMSVFTIGNVKVSVKTCMLPLHIVCEKLKTFQIPFQEHNNFIVAKSKYTFIIFKAKLNCNTNHINITKIPCLSKIADAVGEIETLLNCITSQLTIDNISATSTYPEKLDLVQIVNKEKFCQIKYNNQAFPGLFLKFNLGTAILFHSGKINIVGCKREKDLEWILKEIYANI